MSVPIGAASVILSRGRDSEELFLVRRSDALRVFGGFHAFPGGRIDPADRELASTLSAIRPAQVAVVRELFEETGVLLAAPTGSAPHWAEPLPTYRRALLERQITFSALLERLGAVLRPEWLTPFGSFLTPAFSPLRFDTEFFVAELPAGQSAEVWPGELATGEWGPADQFLHDWEADRRLLSPPTIAILEAIRGQSVRELPTRIAPLMTGIAQGRPHPIAFAPWVEMIPLRTDGLPPSTHTNAYLVGDDPAYLFDPGAADPAEQEVLFTTLDRLRVRGRRPVAVVLTHHHPDHVAGAEAAARRLGVPILAHPETARLLANKVAIDGLLHDGDELSIGAGPGMTRRLQARLTPGHAPGHLVFWEPQSRFLFAGDMISMLSSVAIVPPDGDLAQYLDSVRALQALPIRLLLPAHGSPTAQPAQVLSECLAHRELRERQLLELLKKERHTVPEIAGVLYRGLAASLRHLAEAQTLAGLLKLEREQRAKRIGDTWQVRS